MKKRLIALLLILSLSSAQAKTYILLATTQPDKVVVEEIEHVNVNGFDAKGRPIISYFNQKQERHLTPQAALDIAIRHINFSILEEAIYKLQMMNEQVDISGALNIISDELIQMKSNKKWGYLISGIMGAFSVVPWFFLNDERHNNEKWIFTCFGGACAIIAAASTYFSHKNACKRYATMVQRLFESPVCYVSRPEMIKRKLTFIKPYLHKNDQPKIDELLALI